MRRGSVPARRVPCSAEVHGCAFRRSLPRTDVRSTQHDRRQHGFKHGLPEVRSRISEAVNPDHLRDQYRVVQAQPAHRTVHAGRRRTSAAATSADISLVGNAIIENSRCSSGAAASRTLRAATTRAQYRPRRSCTRWASRSTPVVARTSRASRCCSRHGQHGTRRRRYQRTPWYPQRSGFDGHGTALRQHPRLFGQPGHAGAASRTPPTTRSARTWTGG